MDRGGEFEMTENTTTQHIESIKGEEELVVAPAAIVNPVPETAVSKE